MLVAIIAGSAVAYISAKRVAMTDMPQMIKGPAIALVTAGLMSLAFMGFSGLD